MKPITALEQRKTSIMRASLEAAGFQPYDLIKAMNRTREALNAKKVVTATHEGTISDEKSYIDHGTRLEAADRIFKMVPGMYAQAERSGGSTSPLTVEVVTMNADGSKTMVRVITGPDHIEDQR